MIRNAASACLILLGALAGYVIGELTEHRPETSQPVSIVETPVVEPAVIAEVPVTIEPQKEAAVTPEPRRQFLFSSRDRSPGPYVNPYTQPYARYLMNRRDIGNRPLDYCPPAPGVFSPPPRVVPVPEDPPISFAALEAQPVPQRKH